METNEYGYRTLSNDGLCSGVLSDGDVELICELQESKEQDIDARSWVRRVYSRLSELYEVNDDIINEHISNARKRLKYAEAQQSKRIRECSLKNIAKKFGCTESKARSAMRKSTRSKVRAENTIKKVYALIDEKEILIKKQSRVRKAKIKIQSINKDVDYKLKRYSTKAIADKVGLDVAELKVIAYQRRKTLGFSI